MPNVGTGKAEIDLEALRPFLKPDDLVEAVTPLRIATFAVNLAIVVWLVCSKRLFGVRGGVRAFHAARESEAILQVEAASH